MTDAETCASTLMEQVRSWNATSTSYPRDKTVAQLFEETAAAHADSVALVFDKEQLTYGELNTRANQLAHHLRKIGVGPEAMVGCCMERSIELIVAMVAVLKAGGAYVPLDPAYPKERLNLLLEDTRPQVMLTQQSIASTILADYTNTCLVVDAQPRLSGPVEQNPVPVGGPKSLAYVMYTSGSTGRPKGVMVEHRAIIRLVRNTNYCRFGTDEVFLQFAPISFDASTLEIWGPLLNGGRLVIMPPQATSLEDLGRVIREQNVTVLWLTAGLFNLMVEERLEDLRPVRQLLAGGDVLSPRHVRSALNTLQDCNLINGYGPTENTTFTCCHTMRAGEPAPDSIPIGRPISNTQVYILDEQLRPVPPGAEGELYAGGDGLARGYLNDPQATEQRFLPNPFVEERGARMYRTGDLARWRADGVIEFLGHRPFGQEPEAAWEAPVTESQLEIWLSDQLGEEASCSYNEAFTLHMRGHVNEAALRRALTQIVNRHDSLRATFNEEGNCQRFAPKLDLEIPTVDLTQLTPGEREARLKEIVKQNAHTPFDLGEGPLIRAQWIYLEARYQLLIFTAHQIVCDGWSTNVLIDEIAHAYNSIVRDASLELPAPMSFAAYAKRQQEFLNSPEGAKVEQYWLEQFKQPGPLLDLPLDHPRPSVRGFDGATYRYKIGTEAYNNIKKMGARQKCTLFITLLAGLQILLNRLSGQDDVVVGVPTAGQSLINDAILVGHCVNFIPLRSHLAGNLTAAEFLAQMKQTVLAGYDHQNYTYGRLVRKLALRRDPSRLPLTEILFNLERIGDGLSFDGIEAEIDPNPKSFVNFDLFINVLESKDGLVIDCDYDTGLFEEETIARWLGHYELLLEGMVANVDQPISKLPLTCHHKTHYRPVSN